MATPSSYYCSTCRTDWASDRRCPTCGQPTFPQYNGAVVDDRRGLPLTRNLIGTQATSAGVAYAWRVERYLELGFTEAEAHLLASTRDYVLAPDRTGTPRVWSCPLYWLRVSKALAAGCSHALALHIFT